MTSLNSAIPPLIGAASPGNTSPVIKSLFDLVSEILAEPPNDRRDAGLSGDPVPGLKNRHNGRNHRIRASLEAAPHGVLRINASGEVCACNNVALKILGIAGGVADLPSNITGSAPQIARLRILQGSDNADVEVIELSARHFAKVHSRRAPRGEIVVIIEDVDLAQEHTSAHKMAEAEYRSLFENAVCGIYRDHLDSTPVRCNPALAVLNGYKTEAEYIEAVTGTHGGWYVDRERGEEFKRLMRTEGRVKDFVSQVHRHRTKEKFWITENAWFVRDADGNPIFIEGTIQDATERITTMAIIEREANLDALTGAASRFRFLREIEEKTRPGKAACALYCVDLDRFKEVNDLLGHAAGDFVLAVTAQRLQSLVTEAGLVARLGGDEFAILQPNAGLDVETSALAEKIVAAMREPILVGGQNLIVGASIGVAVFPAHAADSQELMSNADLALYQMKTRERGRYRIYDTELRAGNIHRKGVERELGAAIANDQLELYYQPIMDREKDAVVSCEALMRWNHPQHGLLLPSRFIAIAEDAGLMTELGNWAIARACQQAAILPADIKIAVNVSPNQFRSSNILAELRRALRETRLDPGRLTLEITETLILSSELVAERILTELQDMGVQLALDDFGTGYSSLSYLRRFAFREVKIDQSFVAGMLELPANRAVIRAVLGIGRDLGIDVVAEGVNSQAEADALSQEGCVLMQGYFFGKPKPYLELAKDLAAQQSRRSQELAPAT